MKAIRIVDYLQCKKIINVINLESITRVEILKGTAQNCETMTLYQGDKKIITIEEWVKNYEKIKEEVLSHFNFGEIIAERSAEKRPKYYADILFKGEKRK